MIDTAAKVRVLVISLECPACAEMIEVRDGNAIPITCPLCHRWFGPGRAPILRIDFREVLCQK